MTSSHCSTSAGDSSPPPLSVSYHVGISPEECISILENLRSKIQQIHSSGVSVVPNSEVLRQLPPDWLRLITEYVNKQFEEALEKVKEKRHQNDLMLYFTVLLMAIEYISTRWCKVDMTGLTARELQKPIHSNADLTPRLILIFADIYLKVLSGPGLSPFNPARDCPSTCRRPTYTD